MGLPTLKLASFVEPVPLSEDRSRNEQAKACKNLLEQDSIDFSDYEPDGLDGENDPFNQSFMSNFSITTDRDGEQSRAKQDF